MMPRWLIRSALAALLCWVPSTDAAGQPRSGTATSTGQQGGVNAGYVENLYLDDLPRDPLDRAFVLKMLAYQQLVGQTLKSPNYTVFMDEHDPAVASASADYVGYNFPVLQSTQGLNDKVARCDLEGGGWLVGYKVRMSVSAGIQRFYLSPLTEGADGLLTRLCTGLNRPVAWLAGEAGVADSEDRVWEYVLPEGGDLSITIVPAVIDRKSPEELNVGGYWGTAFSKNLRGVSMLAGVLGDPKALVAVNKAFAQATEVELPSANGNGQLFTFEDLYSLEARKEFGQRIEKLDSSWRAFLASHPMVYQGNNIAMVDHGKMRRFVPRFTTATVGSKQFWNDLGFMNVVREQTYCDGARFLVDKGYTGQKNVPEYGQCSLLGFRSNLSGSQP